MQEQSARQPSERNQRHLVFRRSSCSLRYAAKFAICSSDARPSTSLSRRTYSSSHCEGRWAEARSLQGELTVPSSVSSKGSSQWYVSCTTSLRLPNTDVGTSAVISFCGIILSADCTGGQSAGQFWSSSFEAHHSEPSSAVLQTPSPQQLVRSGGTDAPLYPGALPPSGSGAPDSARAHGRMNPSRCVSAFRSMHESRGRCSGHEAFSSSAGARESRHARGDVHQTQCSPPTQSAHPTRDSQCPCRCRRRRSRLPPPCGWPSFVVEPPCCEGSLIRISSCSGPASAARSAACSGRSR